LEYEPYQKSPCFMQSTVGPCLMQIRTDIPQNYGGTKPSKSTEWDFCLFHTVCRRRFAWPCVRAYLPTYRSRANIAHIRQPRPDPGLGFKVKAIKKIRCSLFAWKRRPTPPTSSNFRTAVCQARTSSVPSLPTPSLRHAACRDDPPSSPITRSCLFMREEGGGSAIAKSQRSSTFGIDQPL